MTRQPWRNWGGNQQVTPNEVHTPGDAAQLQELVRRAADTGRRIKAVGSGHSFTGIAVAADIAVDCSAMAGLIALDRGTGMVTVEAGMPLHRLNRVLETAGLSMTNLGDVDSQTVAGAISTGTHGTGATIGGLSTQVRGLELVLADGSLISCSSEQHPELFHAARVGLGALGIMTTVTLQAEPAFRLHAAEHPMPLPQVLADLDELVDGNEHFEFYWFPHTETASIKCNNRLPAGRHAQPPSRLQRFVAEELFSNTAFGLTCRLGRAVPRLIPPINAGAARLLGDREYDDVSDRVFTSPRRVRFLEMEYAVPREAVTDALAGIRGVIESQGLRVSFPVEVRFAAADDIPLSTATGRDTAYLAVHMFRGQPHEQYFRGVEAVMSRLDGRPHWGKLHYQDAAGLRPRYQHFDDFCELRATVDPTGVFCNDYLDRVLGPAGKVCQ